MSERPEFRLTTPDSVAADPDAVEMLRFWWSRGEPVMAIMPGFDDPAHFGRMLAIAARNVAHVYATNKGLDEDTAYRAILGGLQDTVRGPAMQTVAEPLAPTRGNA